MSYPIAALGVFVGIMGLYMAASPDWFLGLVDWQSRTGLTIAAAIRLVSGLMLFIAAPASRYPGGLRIFGALVFLAGVVLLFLPLDLWQGLFGWVTFHGTGLFRFGGGIGGTLLGLFLVHASRPRRDAGVGNGARAIVHSESTLR